jgi:hypothetical protein
MMSAADFMLEASDCVIYKLVPRRLSAEIAELMHQPSQNLRLAKRKSRRKKPTLENLPQHFCAFYVGSFCVFCALGFLRPFNQHKSSTKHRTF